MPNLIVAYDIQCQGITKKGRRCERRPFIMAHLNVAVVQVKDPWWCPLHRNQASRANDY